MDCFEVWFKLSALWCGNRVGLGKFSSRGQVGLTAGVPGEVGLGREGEASMTACSGTLFHTVLPKEAEIHVWNQRRLPTLRWQRYWVFFSTMPRSPFWANRGSNKEYINHHKVPIDLGSFPLNQGFPGPCYLVAFAPPLGTMNKDNHLGNGIIFMQICFLTVVHMQLLTVGLAWPLLSHAEFPYYLIRHGKSPWPKVLVHLFLTVSISSFLNL